MDNGVCFALAAVDHPRETHRVYKQLVDLVGRSAGRSVTLVHGTSYGQVNRMLAAGKCNLAFICTGGYVELEEMGIGARVVAVPVVAGKTTYQSLVLVRQAAPFGTFDDLRGTHFAFVDPLSLTGHRYPLSLVTTRGYTKDSYFRSYVFVGSHDRAIRAVRQGTADAAAIDGLIYDHFKASDPDQVLGCASWTCHRSTAFRPWWPRHTFLPPRCNGSGPPSSASIAGRRVGP